MTAGNNPLQHMKVWGSSREGMSEMSSVAKIALLDDESLMLVSRGAVAKNSLPPGYVRFLSDAEIVERGLQCYIPELLMRVGRKRNDGPVAPPKAEPYYRQFDKRR